MAWALRATRRGRKRSPRLRFIHTKRQPFFAFAGLSIHTTQERRLFLSLACHYHVLPRLPYTTLKRTTDGRTLHGQRRACLFTFRVFRHCHVRIGRGHGREGETDKARRGGETHGRASKRSFQAHSLGRWYCMEKSTPYTQDACLSTWPPYLSAPTCIYGGFPPAVWFSKRRGRVASTRYPRSHPPWYRRPSSRGR